MKSMTFVAMLLQGLMTVNKRLAAAAAKDSNVTYLDCGQPFFASPTELNHDLLPDALHPNADGMIRWVGVSRHQPWCTLCLLAGILASGAFLSFSPDDGLMQV